MDEPTALLAIDRVLRARTVPECASAFRSFLRGVDIDTFACGEADVEVRERSVFHVIDWPEDWQKFYFESGLISRDPVVQGLELFDNAFTWEELRQHRALAAVGTQAMQKVVAAGWVDGLVVPIHRSATRFGLISLVARRKTIAPALKNALVPLAICFHTRVLELYQYSDFPVPPAGLGAREVECIKLACTGRSDAAISAALGIGATTVREYLDRARKKLRAKNRVELAALAMSLGIVRLG